ncbi:MAG: hypothetical protein Fur005_11180 [Roseiflexaceae bacterium]
MPIQYYDPAINYYVDDVERAVRFYSEHFGLIETFRTPEDGTLLHVEVRSGPLILGLAAKEAARAMHGLPVGEGGSPRAEVVIWTDDVDLAYQTLLAHGVPGLSAPHNFLGRLRAAWVIDPDENPVEIVAQLFASSNGEQNQ